MTYSSLFKCADFHPDTQNFFNGKTVGVTGGSGFIGSHTVEQLIALGAKVIVPSARIEQPFLENVREKIEVRRADLRDIRETRHALKDCQVILNLAAQVAGIEYNSKHPATIFQANLQMFFNVIQAAQELKVERLLVTSSACVYPRHCTIPTPEHEGFLEEPEPTNSGYGWAKRMEEYLGQQYSKEHGLSVAIARPYNAYGPRDNFNPKTSHVIPSLILKALVATDGTLKVWGDGSHSRSFLYADDFSRGLLEVAARYPSADPINIGADEEVSIAETARLIADLVKEITGKDLDVVFQPQGITGQPRRKCDTTKAISKIGFQARISFRDGMRRTIEWAVAQGNEKLSNGH